ncbi:site-specific tyrosine recombinase XerD [Mobiluncus mulieris]|uniref:site-specific tyrosine recombinase XerD n=1 Tax=Mobiluncus mulieris TaxID=2052 RepID=UPI0014706084|nr:site-specific tyrosine recombinase XerD [Mobiluncus mulieris]MCU9970108.1 site-specific tyrosine recombinase XerD [Mobiluncus mulieris]MCU9996237.1 site-specific tyrosine recombinase XerD [Mobiluncus mulieris]MCV0001642.1 site-specific tyrosine recombinase XerD [Mobiluncus mulieris]NMW91237.1 site-specific tyrosine recombinase XerD [Mobiluncus mulieris]
MGSVHFANPSWTPGLNPQDFLNYLSVERGASPHTIAAYQRDLQRYVAYLQILGRDTLAQVTEVDLEGFVRALGDGFASFPPLGSTSVRRCLAAARSWHRYLFDSGSLGANVASSVKPAKLPRRLPETLNLEEMEALLAAASSPGDSNSLRDRALLEFLYASGARISEAMNLVLDDIDFETEPALVRLFGKGRKERISMLGHQACQALQAYLVRVRPTLAEKGQSRGRVFLNTYGKPMSRQTAWAIIQAAAKRAQIDRPVHPHTLRHCFATHLLQGGADIRVVQELLGHASVTTTEIYTKVSKQMLLEVYASAHPRARLT